jgi:adenylyl-sulfate kinase
MTGEATVHLVAPDGAVSREMREARQPHRGMAFWFTGLSGSGKSTLALRAEEYFFRRDYNIVVLDGDVLRGGLCRDLGFSPEDRLENNRRTAEVAKLFVRHGAVCICAFISPYEESRRRAREIIGVDSFREIYIACPLEECERRDVKGFYGKARSGGINNWTGISSGFEEPQTPDLIIRTEQASIDQSSCELTRFIARNCAEKP